MIGVFVCTDVSGGGVEKKERPDNWRKAEYYGNGKYLLYSSMPGGLNLHGSVVAKRHENSLGEMSLGAFDLLRYNDNLEVEINGQRIFDIDDDGVTKLQNRVYLGKNKSKRVLYIDEEKAEDVSLKIFKNINDREIEVARVELRRVGEEQENVILVKEHRVNSTMASRGHEGFDL